MNEFGGIRIMITGGASGFGLACAKALLEQGARVAVCDINQAELHRAETMLNSRNALAIELDVSSAVSVRTAVAMCESEFDGLDNLVNCAGIIHVSPLADVSE